MATLYVVATPIGNLGDFSPRAVETLKSVALIAAEDTRVTQKLLTVFDIQTPLTSCHEHNERGKAEMIVRRMLEENIDVAVTTDAGTPCISDPGSAPWWRRPWRRAFRPWRWQGLRPWQRR